MADIADVYVSDLAAETLSSLDGTEGIVGFDSVEGKQIPVSVLSRYAVEKQEVTINGTSKTVQAGLNDLYGITDDLTAAVEAVETEVSWLEVANDIRIGKIGRYGIGDTITDTWTDTALNRSYENPWRVNHFETVETEGGVMLPGMWLQSVYAHPFAVQFSHSKAFLKCPSGLPSGTYYVTFGDSSTGMDAVQGDSWNFTLTKAVPTGGRIAGLFTVSGTRPVQVFDSDGITLLETVNASSGVSGTNLGTMGMTQRNGNLNSMHETRYGGNSWAKSALRQYLNSDAPAGEWWEAQDEWDVRPDQLLGKPGYLSGLSAGLKAALVPVKTITYTNTVQDGGEAVTTYDKVTLISLQQSYIRPQVTGEGEAHEYWIQAIGTEAPLQISNSIVSNAIKHYAVENHTSAQGVRLRSAGRSYLHNTLSIHADGYVSNREASALVRFAPLIFIG